MDTVVDGCFQTVGSKPLALLRKELLQVVRDAIVERVHRRFRRHRCWRRARDELHQLNLGAIGLGMAKARTGPQKLESSSGEQLGR